MEHVLATMMVEFHKLFIPVCALLAGFALATSHVRTGLSPSLAARGFRAILSVAAVALVCAVCAAAVHIWLYRMLEIQFGELPEPPAGGIERYGQAYWPRLRSLFQIAWAGFLLGVGAVLFAIGVSGFMHDRREGLWTSGMALVGAALFAYCVWVAVGAP